MYFDVGVVLSVCTRCFSPIVSANSLFSSPQSFLELQSTRSRYHGFTCNTKHETISRRALLKEFVQHPKVEFP